MLPTESRGGSGFPAGGGTATAPIPLRHGLAVSTAHGRRDRRRRATPPPPTPPEHGRGRLLRGHGDRFDALPGLRLPTNPKLLKVRHGRLRLPRRRGHRVGASSTREGARRWPTTEAWFRQVAETHAAVGAEYIVRTMPAVRWLPRRAHRRVHRRAPTSTARRGTSKRGQRPNKLGRIMKDDYGLQMVLHPHGDSHIETREDIDRIFQATDPEYVGSALPPTPATSSSSMAWRTTSSSSGHDQSPARRRRSALKTSSFPSFPPSPSTAPKA